ncbi:hypothetical protein [Komagataeibacter medellinensis]|uniref:hypothetical protein n=1 Tax=Komagataeibacter medellinensis TaxID=1177712 RepID=UPI001E38784A|nr:hypothetical protein [Komagataeibacter medellinensis]
MHKTGHKPARAGPAMPPACRDTMQARNREQRVPLLSNPLLQQEAPMAITRNVADITTRIGDFLTGAHGDRSGALSVLNDILGPLPAPEHPSMLENRAEAVGLLPVIHAWQIHDKSPPTDEETIHTLFHPAELARFSTQTGLSELAAMNILREMLPTAVRHRAVTAQASRAAPPVQ